jgi:hypothetical protein
VLPIAETGEYNMDAFAAASQQTEKPWIFNSLLFSGWLRAVPRVC